MKTFLCLLVLAGLSATTGCVEEQVDITGRMNTGTVIITGGLITTGDTGTAAIITIIKRRGRNPAERAGHGRVL